MMSLSQLDRSARAITAFVIVAAGVSNLAGDPPGSSLIQVSSGDPFVDCAADFPDLQPGTRYPASEVEPWVVVNPTDPDHIVATWQQDRWSTGGARGAGVAVSFDGGKKWQTVLMPNLTLCTGGSSFRSSDPWLSFSPDGVLHHMSLVLGPGMNAMVVQSSTDGGLSWSDPVSLVEGAGPILNDKNSLTADPTDSMVLYAVWDQLDLANGGGPALLSRSTDGGMTFSTPSVVHDPGATGQTIGNQIVVLPEGTVIDFFNEIFFVPSFSETLALKYSEDQGASWQPGGPAGPSIPVATMLPTFALVDPDLGQPIRSANILFDVAVDPTRGTLAAVWQDARFNGFQYDAVAFSLSTDGGLTWSSPVQVNQTPTDVPVANRQAFVPSVEINSEGRIAVTYYDFRRNDARSGALTDHWAITCDASKVDCTDASQWSGEIRLTKKSFDILRAPLTTAGFFIGDYVGLAAAGNEFVALFSASHGDDPASVFVRVFDEGPKRGKSGNHQGATHETSASRLALESGPLTKN